MPLLPIDVLYLLTLIFSFASRASCIWPMPRSLDTGQTPLVLSSDFTFQVQVRDAPTDLNEAVSRTQSFLKNDQVGRLVVGRGTGDLPLLSSARQLRSLQLDLFGGNKAQSIAHEAALPLVARREEYVLTIPTDGSAATLAANSTLGLLRGLTTFEQLWYSAGGVTYTLHAPIFVHDAPAFVSIVCSSLYASQLLTLVSPIVD